MRQPGFCVQSGRVLSSFQIKQELYQSEILNSEIRFFMIPA